MGIGIDKGLNLPITNNDGALSISTKIYWGRIGFS